MITWILILTMQYYNPSQSSRTLGSVSSVNGFSNEASCTYAGVLWVKQDHYGTRSYICVPSNKK